MWVRAHLFDVGIGKERVVAAAALLRFHQHVAVTVRVDAVREIVQHCRASRAARPGASSAKNGASDSIMHSVTPPHTIAVLIRT